MPELPEVETIKSQLSHFLPLEIKKISFSSKTSKLIKQSDFTPHSSDVITHFSRKGKILIFHFKNPNHYILSHLGMSGSWRISDTALDPIEGKHAHIIIETNKCFLSYVDPRRFGYIYFLNKKNFDLKMNALSMDISEPGFDAQHIKAIFEKSPNKVLKTFLLDQKVFSGVGNYMACEICARAKLLPTRIVKTLTKNDCQKIKAVIDLIIFGAIKSSGTTFGGGYRDAYGEKGEGIQHLVVFHQKICQMCKKTSVIKTVLGGRGTYHCPHCQK
jgi:formamidopyrimidine-DNA glycosylase